jgi:hypothetical protein
MNAQTVQGFANRSHDRLDRFREQTHPSSPTIVLTAHLNKAVKCAKYKKKSATDQV